MYRQAPDELRIWSNDIVMLRTAATEHQRPSRDNAPPIYPNTNAESETSRWNRQLMFKFRPRFWSERQILD